MLRILRNRLAALRMKTRSSRGADQARAGREEAEKRRKEAEDKLKDVVETFKNGEESRRFTLDFAASNNTNIISYLLGEPKRRRRFLNLFEESNEGGLYRYGAITWDQYIGRCEEREMIYGVLEEALGEFGANKLKEKLGLPELYDPIPPHDENVFPPDPNAERNEEEEDDAEAEGDSQREEGRDAAAGVGGDDAAA